MLSRAQENTGHWMYFEEIDTERYFGFIYFIKNLVNDRKYIGKKQYFLSNGKVKRTVNNRESPKWNPDHWRDSGWRNYSGSSKDLTKDIAKYGKENFIFVMLQQCVSKAQLHYGEIAEQVLRDVICERLDGDDSQYAYYNKSIAAIKFRPPEYHSKETKEKLKRLLKENGHPMLGKVHPNKGKKLPQTAPKRCKAAHSFRITNGIENKWWEDAGTIPDGWRKGMLYGGSRKEKLADKAGYHSYDDLCLGVKKMFDDGNTKSSISRNLNIGRSTVDRILKMEEEL